VLDTPRKVKNSKCKIEDCERKSKGLGWCGLHYGRYLSNGDPNIVRKLAKYDPSLKCKIDDCGKKILARQMCNAHYIMWRLHGDPLAGAYRIPFKKALDHGDGTRTCTKCGERKKLKEFHKDKGATDGVRSTCKRCRLKHVKGWYEENQEIQLEKHQKAYKRDIEKIRERDSARYIKDKPKRLILASEHSQIRRARKKKTIVQRGISKLSLRKKIGNNCHYCGILMNFKPAAGRKTTREHATIEHLIPLSKGGTHTWDNCVLACRFCNYTKGSKSIEKWQEE
jgi:5-methylcytosine-specific restriction endonuclease McrA